MSERKYKVLWAESGARDLEEIVLHIAQDSPGNARKGLKRLRDKAAALETLPLRGRVVPELARLGLRSWRELMLKPYRIVYRVDSQTVLVLALIDSRRDLEDLLLERMVRPADLQL
ncbi:MAG: type II toxin-antitoxin system RelE/ParE family toxin [Candidatus Alcyoniella australis]|nr:type II toxin-antitoxin system RelE/ParE family toxin [Candidatus Alcyoniella australis]